MAYAVSITESRPKPRKWQPVTRQALRLPRQNGRRTQKYSSARPGSLPAMWNSRVLSGGVIARSYTTITTSIFTHNGAPIQSIRRLHVTDCQAITGRLQTKSSRISLNGTVTSRMISTAVYRRPNSRLRQTPCDHSFTRSIVGLSVRQMFEATGLPLQDQLGPAGQSTDFTDETKSIQRP